MQMIWPIVSSKLILFAIQLKTALFNSIAASSTNSSKIFVSLNEVLVMIIASDDIHCAQFPFAVLSSNKPLSDPCPVIDKVNFHQWRLQYE